MTDWNVLRDRKFLDLFIGDKEVDNKSLYKKLIMPYMNGKEICNFGKIIGIEIEYNKEKLSRWQYMDKVIEYSINNNKINLFFKNLIRKDRFEYLVDEIYEYDNPETLYWDIINGLFIKINKYLNFKELYIDYNYANNIYTLKSFNEKEIKNNEVEEADFSKIVKSFCKKIKKDNLNTLYGTVTNITDEGIQGGNGKLLFGKLNKKDVAIKILFSNRNDKENRFFDEFINVLMSLQKVEGVVELYLYNKEIYKGIEINYIIMKKYNSNLNKLGIVNNEDELIKIIKSLATIIEDVHECDIIHRDIKPENILIDEDGKLILTDFGIAYYNPDLFDNTGHTVSNEILGNRKFSAPEQKEKNIIPTKMMDIYSLGEIIQWLVTGKTHEGTGREKLGTYIDGKHMKEIDMIVEKALNNNPEKRYKNATEILDIINGFNSNIETIKEEINYVNNNIDHNEIYKYICLNDVASTLELSKHFNYDINNLKTTLKEMWKVNRLIKPAFIDCNPDNNDCNWSRF